MKTRLLLLLILLVIAFPTVANDLVSLTQSTTSVPCEITPYSESLFSGEQLLLESGSYSEGYTVRSVSGDFSAIRSEGNTNFFLSPDGHWLLLRQINPKNVELQLFDLKNHFDYKLSLDSLYLGSITWFNAPNVLITHRTKGNNPEYFPIAIVDVQKNEVQPVFSRDWFELPSELLSLESEPFMPSEFRGEDFSLSPNGKYITWDQYRPSEGWFTLIYDLEIGRLVNSIETDEIGFDAVWSKDESYILSLKTTTPLNNYEYFEYSLQDNTTRQVSHLDLSVTSNIIVDIEEGSWSPNRQYLAYKIDHSPDFTTPHTMQLLALNSGLTIDSCFTNLRGQDQNLNFNFSWSLDSRFLAFEAAMNEKKGVYVYDTKENLVHQLSDDGSRILGWAVSGDNN